MATRAKRNTPVQPAPVPEIVPEPTVTVFSESTETEAEKTFRYLHRKSLHEAVILFNNCRIAFETVWRHQQKERIAALKPVGKERAAEIGQKAYEAEYAELWELKHKLKHENFNVRDFEEQINAQLTPECGWTMSEILSNNRYGHLRGINW